MAKADAVEALEVLSAVVAVAGGAPASVIEGGIGAATTEEAVRPLRALAGKH